MKLYNDDTDLIIESIKDKFKIPPESEIFQEIELLEKEGGRMITYLDDDYPWLLKLVDDRPPVLSAFGDLSNPIYKKSSLISIVGTRNASIIGCKFTEYLSKELSIRNFVTISGLANGIDFAAHKASIKEGRQTVAVIGSGLAQCYPNKKLAEEIVASGGVIVSEFPFFEEPKVHNFPRRNRIIAGFSVGTIVVEAGMKSGSTNTANHANRYGRTVFAVPGFPSDYRSVGTNNLIKDGAIMVTSAHDILDELKSSNYVGDDNLFQFFDHNRRIKSTCDDTQMGEIESRILSCFNSKVELDINNFIEYLHDISFGKLLICLADLEVRNVIVKGVDGKFMIRV